MNTRTLSFLLMTAIGLVLAPGARAAGPAAGAADEGTLEVQVAPSDNDTQVRGDVADPDKACGAPSRDCVAVGHWNFDVSLGAGVRTDPVVHEADIPLVAIPHFSYYGKRVFIEDLDLGVTLTESAASTLSLIASPGYDRVFFYRSDLQNIFVTGLPTEEVGSTPSTPSTTPSTNASPIDRLLARPRHWTYLAGPEWTFQIHGITGQLDILHEITAQNHGNEVRAAIGIPLIESRNSLSANAGLTWKGAAIVNYYYGAPGIYQGGNAVNPFVKLAYSRAVSSKWRLVAFVHYEHLGNAIADSPIVNAHYVMTVFAGASYAF